MANLVVEKIGKEYPTRDKPLVILRRASFELSAGENLAILGPSGSGKSTLLHIIGGMDPPTNGTVKLDGQDPYELGESDLASFRNKNVGFIFQEHHLLPQLSVLENVLVPVMAENDIDASSVQRAKELLDRVGLADRLDHRPAELSGGERQRAAVARSLIRGPQIILADEPTGSLDRANAQSVAKLLIGLQQQEKAMLVVVTHSHEIALLIDRRVEINEGRLRDAE
ncbi:MAG: lipoprotein-releasing system ATP-binding protein [Pirellulaceae bacterium]|jgi:lipoprotein-releasing system ATP-binding protein